MPDFTITIPDKALPALQHQVDLYNGNNGTQLSLRDWLELHALELALQDQFAAAIDTIKAQTEAQAQADFDAAIKAERERLITGLSTAAPK